MSTARTPRGHDVYGQLAQRLKQMVRDEHANNGTGAERFLVSGVSPLMLEQVQGDLVLEDGDPDFTVGAWLRQYMLKYTLTVGDTAWCLREGKVWHVVDVEDPGGQAAWA